MRDYATAVGLGTWYDKEGNPLTDILEWARLREDPDYSIVKQEVVEQYWVSTIWLGLDHGFSLEPAALPVIFETMVFPAPEHKGKRLALEYDCQRYCTEEEALAGHEETVLMIRATSASLEEALDGLDVQRLDE